MYSLRMAPKNMFKNFDGIAGIKYGISEKSDGAMEPARNGLVGADNRRKFFVSQKIDLLNTVSVEQPHSADVVKVFGKDRNKIIPEADGLVTSEKNLFLTITVADCFPIYFYNQVSKSVGIVHSGWRGTVGNIAGQAVKAMGGKSSDIIAGIGPGIQACHFEIKEDVLGKFADYPEAIIHRGKKIFIDLPKIISRQLIEAGLNIDNIESVGQCTFCEKEKFFSYRRDKPNQVEAMIAYIGLGPSNHVII